MADNSDSTQHSPRADSVEPSIPPPEPSGTKEAGALGDLMLSDEALELLGGASPKSASPEAIEASSSNALEGAQAAPVPSLAESKGSPSPTLLEVEPTPPEGIEAPTIAAPPPSESERRALEAATFLPAGPIAPPATARKMDLSSKNAKAHASETAPKTLLAWRPNRREAVLFGIIVCALGGGYFFLGNHDDAPPPMLIEPAGSASAQTSEKDGSGTSAPSKMAQEEPKVAPEHLAQTNPQPQSNAAALPAQQATPSRPKPPALPLDFEHVDQLDYKTLRSELDARAATLSPSLALWAQFRLAHAFGDRSAKDALHETVVQMQQRSRRQKRNFMPRDSLERAAKMGAVLITLGPRNGHALLRELDVAQQKPTPQLRYVRALARALGAQGLWGEARTELSLALDEAPHMVDGQLLLGQAELDSHESRAGIERLSQLVLTGSDDDAARAAHLLWRAQAFAALRQVLDQRFGQAVAPELLSSFQGAAPQHQSLLRQLAMRSYLWRAQLADAFELARAESQAAPEAFEATWDAMRLGWLLGVSELPRVGEFLARVPSEHRGVMAFWALDWGVRLKRPEVTTGAQGALEALGRDAGFFLDLGRERFGLTGPRNKAERSRRATNKPKELLLWQLGQRQKQPPSERVLALEEALYALEPPLAKRPLEKSRRRNPSKSKKNSDAIAQNEVQSPFRLATGESQSLLVWLNLSLLDAAQSAQRPALAARAAETLMWTDPLVTDPMVLVLAWAQQLSLARGGNSLPPQVRTTLTRMISNLPGDDRPLLAELQLAQASHNNAEEVRLLDALLVRRPHHFAYTLMSADALIDERRSDEAIARLEALAKLKPEVRDADFLFVYAKAQRERDPMHALASLKTAIATSPQPRAFILKSEIERARNQQDDALRTLAEAERIYPTNLEVTCAHARLLVSSEAYEEAAALLRRALARHTGPEAERAQALETLGDAEHELGQNTQAAGSYKKSLLLRRSREALLKLARLELRSLGATRSAEEKIAELIHMDSTWPEPYYLYGLALQDLGQARGAAQAFETYLKLAPSGEHATEVRELLGRTP